MQRIGSNNVFYHSSIRLDLVASLRDWLEVRWQRLFVNATTEFLQQHGLLDESNGEVTKSSGKKQKKSKSKSLKE